jgi:hypothetical protein
MKQVYSAEQKRKLAIIKVFGPLLMLIVVFYILTSYFDVTPLVAGLISLGVAGADYVLLSFLLGRHKAPDTDKIG